jgi:hypothetical protein
MDVLCSEWEEEEGRKEEELIEWKSVFVYGTIGPKCLRICHFSGFYS